MTFLNSILQKDSSIVSRRVADEVILVPVRHKVGEIDCLYALNEVGTRIWELLDGTRSIKEVRDAIVEEFEVSEKEAEEDLLTLFDQLEQFGAIQEVQAARDSSHQWSLTVDRRSALSCAEFLEQYALPGRPVVIAGVTDGWRARTRWSLDFFRRNYGDAVVTVSRRHHERRMRLAQYIDYMMRPPAVEPWYLKDWEFALADPSLRHDYVVPSYFVDNWIYRLPESIRPEFRWLFMGPAGTGTPMHRDVWRSSAWNTVIAGRKRWLFFPPDQQECVYDGAVDAFRPDFRKFPRFAEVASLECVQAPGDIVFTPSGWWHQVRNDEPGISITENFVNATNAKAVGACLAATQSLEVVNLIRQYLPELCARRRSTMVNS